MASNGNRSSCIVRGEHINGSDQEARLLSYGVCGLKHVIRAQSASVTAQNTTPVRSTVLTACTDCTDWSALAHRTALGRPGGRQCVHTPTDCLHTLHCPLTRQSTRPVSVPCSCVPTMSLPRVSCAVPLLAFLLYASYLITAGSGEAAPLHHVLNSTANLDPRRSGSYSRNQSHTKTGRQAFFTFFHICTFYIHLVRPRSVSFAQRNILYLK